MLSESACDMHYLTATVLTDSIFRPLLSLTGFQLRLTTNGEAGHIRDSAVDS